MAYPFAMDKQQTETDFISTLSEATKKVNPHPTTRGGFNFLNNNCKNCGKQFEEHSFIGEFCPPYTNSESIKEHDKKVG